MPFLLVFNKATDATETLLLFTVCPGFLEVHSSLSLSCKFSSLGWKHCSRHDLILLNISERDSLFSQCLLEALVREKLEEKSIFCAWKTIQHFRVYLFQDWVMFCGYPVHYDPEKQYKAKYYLQEVNNIFLIPSLPSCKQIPCQNEQFTFHLCQFAFLQILYIVLGLWVL